MKKIIIVGVLAVAVIATAIAGFAYYRHSEGYLIGVVTGNGASWDRLPALEELYYNKHDPQTVVPLLIKLLGDSDSGIRAKAIEYLVDSGDQRAVAPLVAMFDGASDESQARDAGQMLANFGADAVPVFLSRLSSPKPYIRGAAAAGLGWVWRDAETGETKTDRAAAKAAITNNALGPLIPMLRDPDAGVRGYVADAMGNIRDKRFLAPLVAVLAAQTDTTLEIFCRVISYYRDDAVAALLPPLQSSDIATRLTAAAALADIANLPTYDIASKGAGYVKAAGDALVQAMSRNDLAAGAGGYLYFIIAGRTAAIPFLVTALNTCGGTRMAQALLNSGEKSLEDAATAWAKGHGYQITTHHEPGKSTYRWGGG